jgi:hypothetical protein
MEERTMRSLTGKSSIWRLAANLVVSGLLVSGVLLVAVAPAFAAGYEAPPTQDGRDERGGGRLEFAYLRLQQAAEGQAMRLDHAGDIVEFVHEWIDELAAQGEDVTLLQDGLDAFRAAIDEAQNYQRQAQAVLDEHAGFDEKGKVVDRQQAVETVRQAGRALRDGHRALKDGTIQLRRAVNDWRRQHRPRSTETQ